MAKIFKAIGSALGIRSAETGSGTRTNATEAAGPACCTRDDASRGAGERKSASSCCAK